MPDRAEIDFTHDPQARSWVDSANGHAAFPIQNLPLGVFSFRGSPPRCGAAIGHYVVDLEAISRLGLADLPSGIFGWQGHWDLRHYFGLPAGQRRGIRREIFEALSAATEKGARASAIRDDFLYPGEQCEMRLPAEVGDYTDFYAGIHHARNGGERMGRQPPLPVNYHAMPIAYHGRASTIRCADCSVRRPRGQRLDPVSGAAVVDVTRKLDFEMELGAWIGTGNEMGVSVPIDRAEEMLVGLCLLNDLSARDFQGWEIVPLGPFLSKNFATVISPWVVTIEALAPFRRPRMERDASAPPLLPYLDDPADAARGSFSIELQVELSTVLMRERRLPPFLLSRSHASYLYWTFAQMIAHHTVGGCSLRAGDLLGSGTISAPVRSGYGSLAEITTDGSAPVALPSGERRTYLQNGDRVAFSAVARSGAYVPIGFGRSTVEIAGDE